jgi:hypothetical protein
LSTDKPAIFEKGSLHGFASQYLAQLECRRKSFRKNGADKSQPLEYKATFCAGPSFSETLERGV